MIRKILIILLLVTTPTLGTQVQGGDNVLLLPDAKDPKNPPKLVLHGGGKITDDVFEKFVELAGGKNARIVFIPNAGYRQAEFDTEEEFIETLRVRFNAWPYLEASGQIERFQFLYTDEPDDAQEEEFIQPLLDATGVWFSGGAQGRLNYRYVGEFPARTKFQIALSELLERGGVVGGTSAGMAAMPEIMTLWQEDNEDGRPASAVAVHGLGLMRGAIVEQHFDTVGGRLERFTGLLRDAARLNRLSGRPNAGQTMVGLAVEESTGLIVEGDVLTTLGIGNSHIFLREPNLRALEWYELPSGESAQLHRSPNQGTALMRLEIPKEARNPSEDGR